jgi:hypothetical protein
LLIFVFGGYWRGFEIFNVFKGGFKGIDFFFKSSILYKAFKNGCRKFFKIFNSEILIVNHELCNYSSKRGKMV